MPQIKVFVFAPADNEGKTYRMLEELGCELVFGKASWMTPQGDNEEQMSLMAQDTDALIGTSIRSSPITRGVMASSERLRIVAKYTIGVDDIDVEAATELGILVTHAPVESNWGGVAEGTVAMMLTLLKKVREKDEFVRTRGWRDESLASTYIGSRASDGYAGLTVGIVGLGRVGGRFADLLRPWKVRILAYDPYIPKSKFRAHGVEAVDDLSALLRESDVVSLHPILTRETRHMIGAAELTLMRPSAILINTSRGPVVDEAALVNALVKGTITGAALDVFEEEPLPIDSPLRHLGHKVLLSPHMVSSQAGSSGLGLGITWATESVISALKGKLPDNIFNRDAIPRWLERFSGRSLCTTKRFGGPLRDQAARE